MQRGYFAGLRVVASQNAKGAMTQDLAVFPSCLGVRTWDGYGLRVWALDDHLLEGGPHRGSQVFRGRLDVDVVSAIASS